MEIAKRQTSISLPELALVAGTRAFIGAGIGLLLADRLNPEQRKAVGWTLISVGALTTIPLGFEVLGRTGFLGGKRSEYDQIPRDRAEMI